MSESEQGHLRSRLKKLGVSEELRPDKRLVDGVPWDVLIGSFDDTTLVFVLIATGQVPRGIVVRIVNCPTCGQLAFSHAIDTKEDLRLQASQQANRVSQPGFHTCH